MSDALNIFLSTTDGPNSIYLKSLNNFNEITHEPSEYSKSHIATLAAFVLTRKYTEYIPQSFTNFTTAGIQLNEFATALDEFCVNLPHYYSFSNEPSASAGGKFIEFISRETGGTEMLVLASELFLAETDTHLEAKSEIIFKTGINKGMTDEQIRQIVNDPKLLREAANAVHKEFMAQLRDILNRANDPTERLKFKARDEALLKRAEEILLKGDGNEFDYMPNDNAVSYSFLSCSLLYRIMEKGFKDVSSLVECFLLIISTVYNTTSGQNKNEAVLSMKKFNGFTYKGIEVGDIISTFLTHSDYVQTGYSTSASAKHTSNMSYTSMRFARIHGALIGIKNPWSIMNLPGKERAVALIKLKSDEDSIKELFKRTNGMKAGAENFSHALSMIWLCTAGRYSVWEFITGRNDISVPKQLSYITGITFDSYANLQMRTYCRRPTRVSKVKRDLTASLIKGSFLNSVYKDMDAFRLFDEGELYLTEPSFVVDFPLNSGQSGTEKTGDAVVDPTSSSGEESTENEETNTSLE